MVRKRAVRGAIVLTLALGLFSAPVMAADSPERAQATLWSGIEAWFQDLVAGWFSQGPVQFSYQATGQDSPASPDQGGPGESGSGGGDTTDSGPVTDPDG